MTNPETPAGSSGQSPPPVLNLPWGRVSSGGDVYLSITALEFLEKLWASVNGTGGVVETMTTTRLSTSQVVGIVKGVVEQFSGASRLARRTPQTSVLALLAGLGAAQGSLIYASSAGWKVLAPGTSGQFLETFGAGADPAWGTPGGGGGGSGYSVSSHNASYSETTTTGEIVVLVTGAAVTVTLPTAVGNTAKMTFKLTVAGTMTLAASGGQTIDGGTTAVTSVRYTAITLISDNANWWVV